MRKLKVIMSNDFCEMLPDIPLKYLAVVINSVESIEIIDDEENPLSNDSFIIDLINQIKNNDRD